MKLNKGVETYTLSINIEKCCVIYREREKHAFNKCLNHSINFFIIFKYIQFVQAVFYLYGLATTGRFRKYGTKYRYKSLYGSRLK